MCSSPKSSSKCFTQTPRKAFNPMDYEENALMMRRASLVYDRLEQQKMLKKSQRLKQASSSTKTIPIKTKNSVNNPLLRIKSFLLQPIF